MKKMTLAGALLVCGALRSWGAIRSSPSDLSDGRRYYTVGGKLSI